MIEYFRTTEDTRSLVKLDAEEHGCWIALFEPTFDELHEISERFEIDRRGVACGAQRALHHVHRGHARAR